MAGELGAVRTVSAETSDESTVFRDDIATPILIARPMPFPDTRPRFARELSTIELRQNRLDRFNEAHGKEVAAKLQQRASGRPYRGGAECPGPSPGRAAGAMLASGR